MTDQIPGDQTSRTEQDDGDRERLKLRVFRFMFGTCLSITVSLALVIVGFALWTSTKGREDSVAASHTASAKALCDAQYAQREQDDFERAVNDAGDLIVTIASVTPGDARAAQAASIVTKLQGEVKTARASSDARAAYLAVGRPLPCPFPATVPSTG